jgi:hypothetical protein
MNRPPPLALALCPFTLTCLSTDGLLGDYQPAARP